MHWIRRICSLTLVLLMLIAPLMALGQQAPFETVVLEMQELLQGSLDHLEASPDGLKVSGCGAMLAASSIRCLTGGDCSFGKQIDRNGGATPAPPQSPAPHRTSAC